MTHVSSHLPVIKATGTIAASVYSRRNGKMSWFAHAASFDLLTTEIEVLKATTPWLVA